MTKKLDTITFVQRANKLHNSKFNYSKVTYVNTRTKVIITCPHHGDFEQTPNLHLAGKGCLKCSKEKMGNTKKTTTQFVKQSREIHGNKYDYTNTRYISAKTTLSINCPIHGEFKIRPGNHIANKQGCKHCMPKGYSDSTWELLGKQSKNFIGFSLYITKISSASTTESFFKIGKTFTPITKRYASIPYKCITVMTIKGTAKEISLLERKLHKQNAAYKYTPKLPFDGATECFTQLT